MTALLKTKFHLARHAGLEGPRGLATLLRGVPRPGGGCAPAPCRSWCGSAATTSTPSSTARRSSAWTGCTTTALDVETDAEVDEAWKLCHAQAEKWGLHDIGKASAAPRHLQLPFLGRRDNAWEILSNPKGGYTWIFEQGDLEAAGISSAASAQAPDAKNQAE